jgi:preprotein translocase subunit SecF
LGFCALFKETGERQKLHISTENIICGDYLTPKKQEEVMTKRILSVLLSITLILSSFATVGFAQVETKLGFGIETVEGDVVRVPVTLTSLPESLDKLSSLTVNYKYDDSKLSYSGVEQGLLGVSSDNAVDGRVSWYQANSEITSVEAI